MLDNIKITEKINKLKVKLNFWSIKYNTLSQIRIAWNQNFSDFRLFFKLFNFEVTKYFFFLLQRSRWPRGRVLGGSSVLNYMLYIRGNKRDYDSWAAGGAYGWSWDEVFPYFLKSEDNRDPALAKNGKEHLEEEWIKLFWSRAWVYIVNIQEKDLFQNRLCSWKTGLEFFFF